MASVQRLGTRPHTDTLLMTWLLPLLTSWHIISDYGAGEMAQVQGLRCQERYEHQIKTTTTRRKQMNKKNQTNQTNKTWNGP